MPGCPTALPLLLAQAAAPAADGSGGLGQYVPYFYIALAALWFYLIVLRPQQKQDRERRAMIDAVKKGDKVVTSAGIYGTVTAVDADADRVVVRIDDDKGVKVAFTRASIARVLEVSGEKVAGAV